MRFCHYSPALAGILWTVGTVVCGQSPVEKVDMEVVAKIREEGLKRSQVMETISFLTDVHGPRLTASPQIRIAGEWTKNKLAEWKLANPHLEAWGPFGRGWSLEGFTANLVTPTYSPLIAYPKAWSPSTPKLVRGTPIYLNAANEKELEQYQGKLHRAIVLLSSPREVKALFDAPARRQTDATLLALANGETRSRYIQPSNAAPTSAPTPPGAPGAVPGTPFGASAEQRAAIALQNRKWQMVTDEGAAVVIEPGPGDGGTLFVSAARVPSRVGGGSGENEKSAPTPRPGGGPPPSATSRSRPWLKDSPEIIPQVVMAVEHYNRLVRMLEKKTALQIEIDIASRYHADDLMSFNVVAEIPGSDLKDELVMLGGHFDSWHSGTGATDNAVGCGVALEAVRILQAIGVKPRRTIRIALWTGEEQGLLGSKAYVTEHFGKTTPPPPSGTGRTSGSSKSKSDSSSQSRRGPPTKYELKPDHSRFSAYFNLDNGTGKVRGVYLQGNEAVRPIFRAWLAPFSDLGASTLSPSNTGGTDHLSFDAVGLPGFQFIQDPLEYDSRTHHSSMDVFDRLQAEDVKQASVIMAAFVYHAAMRDEKLPRKLLAGEVVSAIAAQQ
jgi:carboxypeptidase Q